MEKEKSYSDEFKRDAIRLQEISGRNRRQIGVDPQLTETIKNSGLSHIYHLIRGYLKVWIPTSKGSLQKIMSISSRPTHLLFLAKRLLMN